MINDTSVLATESVQGEVSIESEADIVAARKAVREVAGRS